MTKKLWSMAAAFIVAACRALAGPGDELGICTPASLTRIYDLRVAGINHNTHQVILTPGSISRPATCNVPAAHVGAVSFYLTGEPYVAYYISLSMIRARPAAAITASHLECYPGRSGALNEQGDQLINVGATLDLMPGLPPGTYSSRDAFITVNYN